MQRHLMRTEKRARAAGVYDSRKEWATVAREDLKSNLGDMNNVDEEHRASGVRGTRGSGKAGYILGELSTSQKAPPAIKWRVKEQKHVLRNSVEFARRKDTSLYEGHAGSTIGDENRRNGPEKVLQFDKAHGGLYWADAPDDDELADDKEERIRKR